MNTYPSAVEPFIVTFWRDAGQNAWFSHDAAFDERLRTQFLDKHREASAGTLQHWLGQPRWSLGLVLLLDQFPRNAFRGTPAMYATDELARRAADVAIERGFDEQVDQKLRIFFYLPFEHSEDREDQARSVALHERCGFTEYAKHHQQVVERFGRFPHRNAILGRPSTAEELEFLKNGGFAG
jgi:uncharacterized protein (DUF924 family)